MKSRAQSETAFEEQLWAAQKTLEAGNLEEAEKLYRSILGKSKRNPRALLGLARVFQKMARRDGKYPSGFGELMNQMKDCIDEQGKEVAAMQERLRDNGSRNDNSQMMKPQSKYGYAWEAQFSSDKRQMQKEAQKQLKEYYSRKRGGYVQEWCSPALLFKRECLEPMYKNWFFLEPPA